MMGTEILAIPEDYLPQTIDIIRRGLNSIGELVDPVVSHALTKWCDEMDEYIRTLTSKVKKE